MIVKSLAFRTDLIFYRFDGEVLDRGDYMVVRTPSQPGYHWGNLLYFPDPPGPGSHAAWSGLYKMEFADLPVHHLTFGWDATDGTQGEIAPFLAAGFELEESDVMSGTSFIKPAAWNPAVSVRPLVSSADWETAAENKVICREPVYGEAGYRNHVRARMANYRRMAEAGKGFWLGAFLAGKLAGDLGIFAEDGIGRFQSVETLPEFRRRGVCSTLVYEACRIAVSQLKATMLVLEAEPHSSAGRIYGTIGFKAAESGVGLCWWDHDKVT